MPHLCCSDQCEQSHRLELRNLGMISSVASSTGIPFEARVKSVKHLGFRLNILLSSWWLGRKQACWERSAARDRPKLGLTPIPWTGKNICRAEFHAAGQMLGLGKPSIQEMLGNDCRATATYQAFLHFLQSHRHMPVHSSIS